MRNYFSPLVYIMKDWLQLKTLPIFTDKQSTFGGRYLSSQTSKILEKNSNKLLSRSLRMINMINM